jgi:hypothetical protein
MSRVTSKFIKFGTATGEVSSRDVPGNFSPSNYTPTQVAAEGNDKVSAHLKGIDNALGTVTTTGDIALTSFTAADNQSSPANVTGFAFANGTVRAFRALVSITRAATYANYQIDGIQKASSWEISQEYVGDNTGIVFTITSAGQIQYTSTSTGSTADIQFRAQVTHV